MKLRSRIILFVLMVSIISILSLSTINYMISIKALETNLNERKELEALNVSKDIDRWMALQKSQIAELSQNMVVANNYEKNYIYKYLSEAGKRNEGNEYYITFSDKLFVSGSGWVPDSSYDPMARDWYIDAMDSDDFVVSEPYIDARTGGMVITISKAIKTYTGRQGVVASDIQIDYLVDTISTVDVGNDSYAFLIDNKGNIVTHQSKEFNPDKDRGVTNVGNILNGKLNPLMEKDDLGIREKKFKDYDGINRLFFFEDVVESNWKVGVAVSVSDTLGMVNNAIYYTILTTVIILMLSIVVSIYISNSITKPIIKTANIAENIGNLSLLDNIDEKDLQRKDEVGQMYNSYGDIISKLKIFMTNLEESIHANQKVYEDTIDRLNYLLNEAEDTSATTEELSAGMEETTATILSVNESADEINRAISDFSGKVEEGSVTSSAISEKADELSTQFIQAKDNTMELYNGTRKEIEEAIQSSKEVDKIDMLSNAILQISEQTGLLSLNAAIEAARAGESGKGFAVVAEEIRKLAENSNETVVEIQSVTKGITQAVEKLVNNTTKLIDFLENDIINDYEMMVDAVSNYKEDGSSLNAIIEDLSATSEELAASISQISTSINEIAITVEESTKGTTNIAEKNTNIVEAINNINNIMEQNKEVSNKLEQLVSQVKY